MANSSGRVRVSFAAGWLTGSVAVTALALAPLGLGEAPYTFEVSAADYRELSQLGNRTTAQELRRALAILDPHGLLEPYIEVSDGAVRIESGLDHPAIEVALSGVEVPRRRPQSMADMRILVDPGHHGGAWSEVEGRHQQLDERPPVREGDLNWATASILAERFRAAGAAVVLTRGPPPVDEFPQGGRSTFDADEEAKVIWGEQIGSGQISAPRFGRSLLATWVGRRVRRELIAAFEPHDLYGRYDLRRRAAAGEGFDLTLSIHYNTTGPRRDNWLMAFVPGNLMQGEADTPAQRYWALRRALAGELPEMVDLGRLVMEAMERKMRLGVLNPSVLTHVEMPKKIPLIEAPGVFARNLAILKRTPGRVLLVEGPCVDNAQEYERMQDRSVTVGGHRYPQRTREYADAVFAGVQCWLERSSECTAL